MPLACCCASLCAVCVICRKRKQFEDNILLVANENSIDSLDILEENNKANKKKHKEDDLLTDNNKENFGPTPNESDEDKESDDEGKNKDDEDYTKSEEETIDEDRKFYNKLSSLDTTNESEVETKSEGETRDEDKKPDDKEHSLDRTKSKDGYKEADFLLHSTTEAVMETDPFALTLSSKLQEHVDREFNFVDEEIQKFEKDDRLATRSSSMSRIDVETQVSVGRLDVLALRRFGTKNESSFLNKFRSKLVSSQRNFNFKAKGNKIKKMLIKNKKEEAKKESKVFGGEKNHQKYHPNFDAKT